VDARSELVLERALALDSLGELGVPAREAVAQARELGARDGELGVLRAANSRTGQRAL